MTNLLLLGFLPSGSVVDYHRIGYLAVVWR